MRILIVEDEVFVALDTEAIVTDAGYTVVGAVRTADAAVSAAQLLQPDVILMDIRLVGSRDGIDAALEIRRLSNLPIVFITAHDDSGTVAKAAQANPLAILRKPVLSAELLAVLKRVA